MNELRVFSLYSTHTIVKRRLFLSGFVFFFLPHAAYRVC